MQETIVVKNPWSGDASGSGDINEVTVFGCDPGSRHECLRDRATVAVYGGAFSVSLKVGRAELLALAELLRQSAETIPEGS